MSAMEMIHQEPVRWTHKRMVACEGGGGPAGHPKIYINTDKPEICTCSYCGLPFVRIFKRMVIIWHRKANISAGERTPPKAPRIPPSDLISPCMRESYTIKEIECTASDLNLFLAVAEPGTAFFLRGRSWTEKVNIARQWRFLNISYFAVVCDCYVSIITCSQRYEDTYLLIQCPNSLCSIPGGFLNVNSSVDF